ncbi:hypothetical protein AK812_SmicGene46258 [Symbiodinium microadriaticum]|uniref:Uncharacterized protein n=2 Tax=Symbiodinium TaxID=2949 RepID=A0A1Q9BUA1_SYMMI|nr:hypothetical protein AK812_SmicGene46258 [Symbiodinium microadriaticum]
MPPIAENTVSETLWSWTLTPVRYHSVRKQLELAGLHDETGLEFLSWLGLLQDMPLPQAAADCPLDVVAQLLQRPETAYQSGERDMAA